MNYSHWLTRLNAITAIRQYNRPFVNCFHSIQNHQQRVFLVCLLVLAGNVLAHRKHFCTNKKEAVCSRSRPQDTRSIWRLGSRSAQARPQAQRWGQGPLPQPDGPCTLFTLSVYHFNQIFFCCCCCSCNYTELFYLLISLIIYIFVINCKSSGILLPFLYIHCCVHWDEMSFLQDRGAKRTSNVCKTTYSANTEPCEMSAGQ